ncbi:endolytic transglycosylase MltG [Papillibacter cinnamivorans]|uniref:Endolytic murein transglycosylase n=1 Tax=Papillibacter cinnamivorans DSM 12816 TaxID=1122930 RepID=A0A1W1ZI01_9FIRM|nr:endolytic transglycosylase MltG [Papillibacter cinnamivorans]SMC47822.1 UPF0755 protein [Papillibacter cinnamivorans DSM 12816]
MSGEERFKKSNRGGRRPSDSGRSARDGGRKPRRRSRGLFGNPALYIVFVLCVSALLAALGWIGANDVLALNKKELTAVVEIGESDSLGTVATKLKKAGIIEFRGLFLFYGAVSHADSKISEGSYELNTDMDYRAIVTAMGSRSASRMTVSVTIPEGYTIKQTFELLEEKGVNDYQDLMDTAANHDFDYDFLKDLPLGDATRLEGYLFPDTYEFYLGESPENAINRLLKNFSKKFDEDLSAQVGDTGYSKHQIVIIASLIEKEAANDEERAKIASVIYNRLRSSSYPYLQIDATVQYALPERKEQLTEEDLKIDSPYNTYLYQGLPAGPIANPGLASIKAALKPASTSYYFYILGKDGVHHFFKTYQEFVNYKNSLSNG